MSPSTCAVLYAASAPFWYVAARRVRAALSARTTPTIALAAAFTFVIMMFNLPLPGGTTGHAIGVVVAVLTVGPWGAVLAMSVALGIQALVFGDGGILTFGANALNIAVVAPLVAHVVYRAIAAGSPSDARRIWAAGAAGYLAVNAAALLTAVEFGLQPALFTDASGTPLYSPYPLSVAVPAMMLGHLTIAGLAEAIVSMGVLAWVLRGDRSLLFQERAPRVGERRTLRRAWVGLALVLLATPLGLLAAGTAWGEWSHDDFRDPSAREEMTRASAGVAPPVATPEGLERLGGLWSAPLPDYAPAFLRSEGLGYLLSAMFGVGLVMLTVVPVTGRVRSLRERVGSGRGD